MIHGEASTTVTASPTDVLDFVCDVAHYKQADTKIRRVLGVRPDGEDRIVTMRSRLRGIPTPPVRQRVHRTGDSRLDITDMPSWQNRLVTFHGYVTATATPAGTAITHREEFDFHGPLRPVAERWLDAWLAADVSAEVDRMRQILNGPEVAQG